MINYTWKILKIFSKNELITKVKYKLIGDDQTTIIESEGTYCFQDPVLILPFRDITESIVINWLETETTIDGKSHIKTGIEKQFNDLENVEVVAPWLPQVYTPI